MKKIEILKRRLTIKYERIKKDELDNVVYSKDSSYRKRIGYLLLVLGIIILSSKHYLIFSPRIKNNLATKDIIAPYDLDYNDSFAKDELIQRVIQETTPVYNHIDGVRESSLNELNRFFNLIKSMNNKEENIESRVAIVTETMKGLDNVNIIRYFLLQNANDIDTSKLKLRTALTDAYHLGVTKDKEVLKHKGSINDITKDLSREELVIFRSLIEPNYLIDEEATKDKLEQQVAQLDDVLVHYPAGTLLVKKGSYLTKERIALLKAYGLYGINNNLNLLISLLIYIVVISSIIFFVFRDVLVNLLRQKRYFRSTAIILIGSLLVIRFTNINFIYLLPIDTLFFLLSILIAPSYATILCSSLLILSMPIIDFDIIFFLSNSIGFLYGLYLLREVKNRTSLISAGIKLGFVKLLATILISTVLEEGTLEIFLNSGAFLLAGNFSGMLTISLLPYFEKTFNILTTFRLIELGDLSHPLLRKLSVTTPGTFHHSMMVATLSENAAAAIGADATFTRVASYYHDIGKMKRPSFYIENQKGGENPHNNLTPTMSTLIITSHTKDGVEMGKEYGIPREIRDIMVEHQGTTLLAYFFNKAKQEDSTLREIDFRYSGPKPRTKESAIIMLADSIEAAVRSLDEKTPITIEKMLRKIIHAKIEDEQLSEADLTFKEIEKIISIFTEVLMGIHHVRIKYPGQK